MDTNVFEPASARFPLIAALLVLAACAAPPPAVDRSPEAVLSFDGLAPVENSVFSDAWADAEIDFSRYSKIVIAPAEFEFRAVRRSADARASGEREFWIGETARTELVDVVTSVFREELAASTRWEIVEVPGPDTLILVGGLLDIVSRVPPEQVGRNEVFLSSVGDAVLVLEARDSESGQTVFRGVDRSSVDSSGRGMSRANAVTTWAEVRRWARRWAVRLREGMDSVPTG